MLKDSVIQQCRYRGSYMGSADGIVTEQMTSKQALQVCACCRIYNGTVTLCNTFFWKYQIYVIFDIQTCLQFL